MPFVKGGAYSPYYADVYLVIDWEDNGERIRNFDRTYIRNETYYFRPGLTWPLRTTSRLAVRVFPAGAIFGHKGPVAFSRGTSTPLLGVMNSQPFFAAVMAQVGAAARSYEVGLIQNTPLPNLGTPAANRTAECALQAASLFR